jgi:hypothetical protein
MLAVGVLFVRKLGVPVVEHFVIFLRRVRTEFMVRSRTESLYLRFPCVKSNGLD